MKIFQYPEKNEWASLVKRPSIARNTLNEQVSQLLSKVKNEGDNALFELTEKFDGIKLTALEVTKQEIAEAENVLPKALKKAIQTAKSNIEKFHKAQVTENAIIETTKGIQCWRKNVGIQKVGLYIPGGTAPLFSTVLMLGIPAKIANCEERILCSPPNKNGKIHPAILYAAKLVGIQKIFKIGGAQAVAAMAYGTESIPQVYKIFGPGNQYVTKAKELVQQAGVAIDMPAGPSEVLVIADKFANPAFVAADLLSQAEHGTDSQVILLSDSQDLVNKTLAQISLQVEKLPRKNIAQAALQNSKAIVLNSLNDCIELSNFYAPEHLIIATENYSELANKIVNAGSVFLGKYSCESAGDYASGTNHTLPTNGFARNYSGVSLDSFVKKITFQEISKQGILNLGETIEIMAAAEQLEAHKNAVSIRLENINNEI